MGLLIVLIIVGVIWYHHQNNEEEDEEQTKSSQKTFEQFQKEQKESNQDNSFYISEVPYGIRRKTAMDTYLRSERTNVTKGFNDSKKADTSNSDHDSEDKEVTADDFLVNTETGELTTPQIAFNKSESNSSSNETDSDSIVPVSNHNVKSSNSKEGVSTSNESRNGQEEKQHYRENWKADNYKSIDDILGSSSKEQIK